MKKSQLKELKTLAQEHAKIKQGVMEMCSALDATKDIKDKEAIKIAIDKSVEQLNTIEATYQSILDSIPLKDARDR